MKIILVNPSCLSESGRDLYSAHLAGPLFTIQPDKLMTLGVPLALPTLAAHTPADHSVKIVDEEIEEIDFDEPADLVGLTAMTFKAERAYEIANEFRKRGVPVVMGGIHASMCPEEVLGHVDSVVIGEAEDLWPRVLADSAAGQLKRQYRAESFADLRVARIPRYDLVKNSHYLYAYLQTTRGCPFDCNFCSVTKMSGHAVRKKSPEQVIAEVDALLKEVPQRQFNIIDKVTGKRKRFVGTIAFIDDNFAIDRRHALAISSALQSYQEERGIMFVWYTQVNYMVGFDDELLMAMENAGCQHLFIGFENLDPMTLRSMKKKMNKPEQYEDAIRNVHRHHMRVIFSTIIGDDNTSWQSAENLRLFIDKNHVLHVLLNVLTPYPGTSIFEEIEREGRLLTRQSQKYNIRNVVFMPKGVSDTVLREIYQSLCNTLFRYDAVYHRGKSLVGLTDRLYLTSIGRMAVFLGVSYTCLYLALRHRLRWPIALRMLFALPKLILCHGSLFALELLVASADYDDFLYSEIMRIGGAPNREEGRSKRAEMLIEQTIRDFSLPHAADKKNSAYRGFYIPSSLLISQGIQVSEENTGRPILLLGGTSIPISDRKEFIGFLLDEGYEVASIENPIGGPLDVEINPAVERPISLRHFVEHLKWNEQVEGIDIVAQSYSAFEVIRVLKDSLSYRSFVKSITFINPPGLNENTGFFKHIFRFLLLHLFKGYIKAAGTMLERNQSLNGGDKKGREYAKREFHGIGTWTLRSIRNMVRTLREVHDIVTFRIEEPLRILKEEYEINVFLQSDDQVVPALISKKQLKNILSDHHVRLVPGGHNDLFFQEWQRSAFLDFHKEIRARSRS